MIHFVVGDEGSFSMRYYLNEEGAALRDRVRVVHYEELARLDRLPLGTWVFAELDRLSEAEQELVTIACERLAAANGNARVLNHPRQALLRHDLLKAAYDVGLNRFRAWPASAVSSTLRYPVFVRFANQHTGNLTPLLDSRRALDKALASLMGARLRLRDLLVVEFCDTKDANGVYRKYSAYKIGDRIVPRYLECSREWMVKWDWRIFDRERADEERRFLETNPHEAWIREIFRLARIDYGRVDYGVLDGAPQAWEINTNPTIGRGPGPKVRFREEIEAYKAMLADVFGVFFQNFQDAWRAIDTPDSGDSVALALPRALATAIERESRQRRRSQRLGSLVNVVARQPWVRPVSRLVKRGLASVAGVRLRLGARRRLTALPPG
jgi:hypothetical protein